MKPIIGILTAIDNERQTSVFYPYIGAIEKSGGIPVVLPYVENGETLERFVEMCDGFFFTGGMDISPERYGEKPASTCGEIQPYRDELEFSFFYKAFETQKPILGICRGSQLINVALGGTLYQDLPSEVHTQIEHRQNEPKFSPSHEVKIFADTPLFSLTGKGRIKANSFHHQAVKTLGKGLEVMALADDGVIEGTYFAGKRYVRAYQWHPERLYETDECNRKIFDDFINACKKEDEK